MKKKTLVISVISTFLVAALTAGVFFFLETQKPAEVASEPEVLEISLVDQLSEKLTAENIEKDFLKFVDEKYPDSLEKLSGLLENSEYDQKFWHDVTGFSYLVLNDFYHKTYDSTDNVKILENTGETATLSFVGDISLADNWNIAPKYDARGGISGILDNEMLNLMRKSTLMVANSEFTVSSRGAPLSGKMYTFRANPSRLKIYDEMGVDLVSLANNHVYDYGGTAFLDMLDAFEEYGIPHVGAGRNLAEAKKPYFFIINGYKFAFIAATRAEKNIYTPGATETSAGVFRCYDPTGMIELIQDLRDEADFIIPQIHFGTEGSHRLESVQMSSARAYIDAGADAVIGHHAHVLQGVEIYQNKPIIYNLGDFLFDPDEVETAVFQISLNSVGEMEYYMLPALQDNAKTYLLSGTRKQTVINELNSWSVNATLDADGKITAK